MEVRQEWAQLAVVGQHLRMCLSNGPLYVNVEKTRMCAQCVCGYEPCGCRPALARASVCLRAHACFIGIDMNMYTYICNYQLCVSSQYPTNRITHIRHNITHKQTHARAHIAEKHLLFLLSNTDLADYM